MKMYEFRSRFHLILLTHICVTRPQWVSPLMYQLAEGTGCKRNDEDICDNNNDDNIIMIMMIIIII